MKFNKILVLVAVILGVLLIGIIACAIDYKKEDIKCIDGDTFSIEDRYYRLMNVDAPEEGSPKYDTAKTFTCSWLHENDKALFNVVKEYDIMNNRDTYNRILIDLPDLEMALIKGCLAEPYWKDTIQKYSIHFLKYCASNYYKK